MQQFLKEYLKTFNKSVCGSCVSHPFEKSRAHRSNRAASIRYQQRHYVSCYNILVPEFKLSAIYCVPNIGGTCLRGRAVNCAGVLAVSVRVAVGVLAVSVRVAVGALVY